MIVKTLNDLGLQFLLQRDFLVLLQSLLKLFQCKTFQYQNKKTKLLTEKYQKKQNSKQIISNDNYTLHVHAHLIKV